MIRLVLEGSDFIVTDMSDESEREFFKLRKGAKTYISKVFSFNSRNPERVRQVRMVLEGSDRLHLGELEGAMCLRLTGNSRKTQVSALVTQDQNQIKRLTLQTFKSRSGAWIESVEKDEFTFRGDEFERLLTFLRQIEFIDMSNDQNFQIEDISSQAGPKAIIDASDRHLVERIKNLGNAQREAVLRALQQSLTKWENTGPADSQFTAVSVDSGGDHGLYGATVGLEMTI